MDRIRELLKSGWVFLVAAGAIILSAILLAVGIRAAHAQDVGYEVEDVLMPASNVAATPQPGTAKSEVEDPLAVYELPELLLAFNERESGAPTAKDIDMDEAVLKAAYMVEELFDVALDGEICQAYFLASPEVSPDNRGSWEVEFGVNTHGERRYIAQLDSMSGEFTYLNSYVYYRVDEEGYVMPEGEPAISPAEYGEFQQEALREANLLTQKLFVNGREVTDIANPDFELLTSYAESWEETNIGFAPSVNVYVTLSDGSQIHYTYSTQEGRLQEVFFVAPELAAPAPAEVIYADGETLEPVPVEPVAEEFNYDVHWERGGGTETDG